MKCDRHFRRLLSVVLSILSARNLQAGLVFSMCGLGAASAQCMMPGCLDVTFGSAANGEVVTKIAGYGTQSIPRLVILPYSQPNGDVIYKIGAGVSAYPPNSPTAVFGAARYNLDGTLDTSFNGTGIALTSVAGFPYSAAAQPDGRLLVVGNGPLLVRFTTDGKLDSTFGTGGVVSLNSGSRKIASVSYGIGVQDDGKIVVAGQYDGAMTAWRFTSGGSLDTSFGANGKQSISFAGSSSSIAFTLAFQYIGAEQRIVLGGFTNQPARKNTNNANFAVARLTSTGQLDSSFGTGGMVARDFGTGGDFVYGLAVDAANGLIAGGEVEYSTGRAFVLARFQTDGTPDLSFGVSGAATWQIPNTNAYLQAIAMQSDGHILATGWVSPASVNNMVVVRFTANGVLDSTFGSSGVVTNTFAASGAISAVAYGVVVQPGDGKIVVGGPVNTTATTSELGLARYYP
jgi:uncharacterized delta-60 repeat protein